MKKRDSKGRFKAGESGNPNGRPTGLAKQVNTLLSDENIIYEGDDLEYLDKHIRALSQAGQHDKARELVIETLQYRVPKIGNVSAQGDDKELVVKFEDPEPIPKDHPLIKLLEKKE